jgi:ribonuclease HIII
VEHLNSYHTFKNISPSVYQEIKDFIKLKYKIRILEKTSPGLKESFNILSESIKAHYYTKGKLLFQSSPTNKAYAKLVFDIDIKFSLNTLDEIKQKPTVITSDVQFFIGCDEAGAGETFGSMFLGCVIVYAENLKIIESIFDTPDIKDLNEHEILDKYNKIKKCCKISKIKCGASEIDETSKNTLLDQKYEELLSEAISGKQKSCVIIDDYGIKRGLKSFLKNLESKGHVVIVELKADEKYLACQAASVVARKERFEEIQNLNREFNVQDKSGRTIYPGSGNAANPKTAEYLEAFMKLYPSKDFPPFVRRKWSNVKKLLQKKYSQKISQFFEE